MGSETHYCDQCGERYQGPGVCDNSHPPAELTPLAAKKPAAKAKAPTKSASPAKK